MELEYKFYLPVDEADEQSFYAKASAWSFLGVCLAGPKKAMHSLYFDTPDRVLDRNQAVLRLRSEQGRYIMTLKLRPPAPSGTEEADQTASGRTAASRHLHRNYEFNVPLKYPVSTPPIDLLPLDTAEWKLAVPDHLAAALPLAKDLCGEIIFTRQQHLISVADTEIEVAVDFGHFKNKGREEAFAEVEFELKKGDADYLDRLAAEVSRRYALKPGIYSKYQRCKAL